MRACVAHGAGDLRVEERPEVAPAPGEVAVAVALGGICGSDLHYYRHGRVGDFRLREPMVLGHEVVGTVAALGGGVGGPEPGTRVAVHPATPCGSCPECRAGRANVCRDTRYLGSAARTPHVQGGFAELIVVPAGQIRVLPDGLTAARAVLAEPLAVALHAVARAGDAAGAGMGAASGAGTGAAGAGKVPAGVGAGPAGGRVLVTGAGPIGCLVIAALRAAGAAEIVAVDLLDEPLRIARAVGATGTVRGAVDDAGDFDLADFDVAIEASGAAAALGGCVRAVRRGGTVVQLGMLAPGDVPFPGNAVVAREVTVRGSFRFDREFDRALAMLADGLPVEPIVTHTVGLGDAVAAFELAGDRRRAGKVLIDLTPG
jgi:L-idonate 5-dehydrogenase